MVITYNILQMWKLGLLLGHNPKNTRFLGTWCVSGLVTRKKALDKKLDYDSFYVLRYVYTLMGFRMFSGLFKSVVSQRLAVLYISHNVKFSGNVVLYAMLAGEAFSSFSWVAGAMTNWRKVIVTLYMIYIYYLRGFKINHKHKKRMVILAGVSFSRLKSAGMAFFFRLQEASVALQEGGSANLMSTGIADTDVMASELNLPLAANDVSSLSLHFFAYYMTVNVIKFKVLMLLSWKSKLKKSSIKKLKLTFLNTLAMFNPHVYGQVDFTLKQMTNKLNFDSNFILDSLNGYITGGDIKQVDQGDFLNYRINRGRKYEFKTKFKTNLHSDFRDSGVSAHIGTKTK